MRCVYRIAAMGMLATGTLIAGCADKTPPPPRVGSPSDGNQDAARHTEPTRPLDQGPPEGNTSLYYDEPLVHERPPEAAAFVRSYENIGRPRIVLFVNRTLEGSLIPVNPEDPYVRVEHERESSTGTTVERRDTYREDGYYERREREQTDRYQSEGPGKYSERTEVYLQPGQYDEVAAKSIDYEAMEAIMTDWIACEGQVTVMSPTLVRQKLTDEQVAALQSGRPQVLREIAEQLDADVLIQVQAKPTRQTRQGLEVRVIAEAMNIRGGQSIGRAVVDFLPPLEKVQLNKYTRFLARKLMDDMTGSWQYLASQPPAAPANRGPGNQGTPSETPPVAPPPTIPAPPPSAPAPTPVPPTVPPAEDGGSSLPTIPPGGIGGIQRGGQSSQQTNE